MGRKLEVEARTKLYVFGDIDPNEESSMIHRTLVNS